MNKLFLPVIAAVSLWAAESPSLVGPAVISVNRATGAGQTTLTFRNEKAASLHLLLAAGPPQQVGATAKSYDVPILFATGGAPPGLSQDILIPHDGIVSVNATLRGLWDAGQFEADLLNGEVKFAKLKIDSPPLAIKVDGAAPDKVDLSLADGSPVSLYLKNDDTYSYPLLYRLMLEERQIASGEFVIPANGRSRLEFTPTLARDRYLLHWLTFSWCYERIAELLKPEQRSGELLVYLRPDAAGAVDLGAPIKRFPVKATLGFFSDPARQFFSYFIVVLILTLGGVSSLVLSFLLPHRLQKLNIKEQLEALARTIASLGGEVNSRLGVVARVERSRLYDLLKSRSTISPDFVGIINQCTLGVAKLSGRVAMMQQLDLVIAQLKLLKERIVIPTKIDRIQESLAAAIVILGKSEPADEDLKLAETRIKESADAVASMQQPDPAFAQELKSRVTDMVTDMQATVARSQTFLRIQTVVPGPWGELIAAAAAPTVESSMVDRVDTAAAKVDIIRTYVLLVDGTTDPEMRARLLAHEARLLGYLQLQTWDSLASARLLVREMESDVYPDRLAQALASTPPEAAIRMDPAFAYDRQPLKFRVRFHSLALDAAAAREEWTCNWDFGDGFSEEGWEVSHYFLINQRAPRSYPVQVTFRDSGGHPVSNDGTPVAVERKITVAPSRLSGILGERTLTEVMRLSAALLVAIFGLVAGAKDQLTKLDILPGLVAIFLVGFGADTIKNLLTSKSG